MLKRIPLILITILIAGQSAGAYEPYINYTYSSDNLPYIEPQAYVPVGVIRGRALGIGDFEDPSDVFVSESGKVYIVDSGNDRIVILSDDFSSEQIISGFDSEKGEEAFNAPQGIFVDSNDHIYVADTENKRIVKLDPSGKLLKVFPEPVKALDIVKFEYKPIRVSVDKAGRLFIVSMNINHGMIELDSEGNFISFFGATRVRANFAELIWRRILTQEQIDTGILSLPTEYSSNDIDGEGFVFGTISATGVGGGYGSQSIRKLNPTGMDILRRMGFSDPVGDTNVIYKDGSLMTSKLTDVCVGDNGMYSVLDLQRGRIFTYDHDGNLLYVFGSIGESEGSFSYPKAIDKTPDGKFLVADGVLDQIVVFGPTQYAEMVNSATVYQQERDYEKAEQEWAEILKYTTNSDIAYVGIGKALLRQGENREAMKYLKLGSNRQFYSKAFKEFRKELFGDIFGWMMSGIALIIACWLIIRYISRFRRTGKNHRGKEL